MSLRADFLRVTAGGPRVTVEKMSDDLFDDLVRGFRSLLEQVVAAGFDEQQGCAFIHAYGSYMLRTYLGAHG